MTTSPLPFRVTGSIVDPNDDEFVFNVYIGDVHLATFELEDLWVSAPYEWVRFLNTPRAAIWFCGSNGEVSICRHVDTVTFTTAKYGAGGDGRMTLKVPFMAAKEALEQAAALAARKPAAWPECDNI